MVRQTGPLILQSDHTILLEADTLPALYDRLIKIAYLTPLIQACLPLGMRLHRLVGIAGLTWARIRLRGV